MSNFYPRSPRGERPPETAPARLYILFLSTLPAWGATPIYTNVDGTQNNFYPRSPRGERRTGAGAAAPDPMISIHAPRVGSDFLYPVHNTRHAKFLSTLPAWGATEGRNSGSDTVEQFLSTLPAWGATL